MRNLRETAIAGTVLIGLAGAAAPAAAEDCTYVDEKMRFISSSLGELPADRTELINVIQKAARGGLEEVLLVFPGMSGSFDSDYVAAINGIHPDNKEKWGNFCQVYNNTASSDFRINGCEIYKKELSDKKKLVFSYLLTVPDLRKEITENDRERTRHIVGEISRNAGQVCHGYSRLKENINFIRHCGKDIKTSASLMRWFDDVCGQPLREAVRQGLFK